MGRWEDIIKVNLKITTVVWVQLVQGVFNCRLWRAAALSISKFIKCGKFDSFSRRFLLLGVGSEIRFHLQH
jgi:hypothetical protein